MMTLDELTKAMHEFVGSKGWYARGTPKPQTPKNIACSLAIEVAEVLEHFQWSDEPHDLEELSGELADVALYLLQLAGVTGIDLEQAILNKLEINANRTWPAPGLSEGLQPTTGLSKGQVSSQPQPEETPNSE